MKTTSFEISKKLASIKFDAETEFYWVETGKGRKQLDYVEFEVGCFQPDWKYTKAYDLETIIEALPKKITFEGDDFFLVIDWAYEKSIFYKAEFSDKSLYVDNGNLRIEKKFNKKDSLVEISTSLLLLLHEKGIINLGERA